MKLLITGGCGFLGSNLAADAIEMGFELCIFDNLYRQGSFINLKWLREQGNFEFVHGDIRNGNDIQRLVERIRPEAVFHLAGQVAMTTSIADPRMDFEVNALGTINLLEAVRKLTPGATVIYSSTNKVYGDLENLKYSETATRYVCDDFKDGFKEDIPLEFSSPYGCSKGSADQYMMDYSRIYGLKTVVFRHSSMYGGRQFASFDQGWVSWFCQKAVEAKRVGVKEAFTVSGSGKQVRDVLHADDMKRLYAEALKNIDNIKGNVFNIGGGMENSLSLMELFLMLEEKLQIQLNYSNLPARSSDQKVFVADIAKVRNLLGWRPLVSAKEGIDRMVQWVNTNI